MKIYVVQYDSSMSPTGEIVAVATNPPRAARLAQDVERERNAEPEELLWEDESDTLKTASGFGGMYTMTEWEVSKR